MERFREQGLMTRSTVAIVLGSALAAAFFAFVATSRIDRTYESRAGMIVGANSGQYTDLLAAQIMTETFAQLATTTPVLEAAIERSGLSASSRVQIVDVQAVPVRDSLTLTIVGHASDPTTAAAIANAVAGELERLGPTNDPRLAAARDSLLDSLDALGVEVAAARAEVRQLEGLAARSPAQEERLTALQDRLPSLAVAQATLLGQVAQGTRLDLDSVRTVDPAVPDPGASSPSVVLNTAIAFAVGLAAAIGWVTLFGRPLVVAANERPLTVERREMDSSRA